MSRIIELFRDPVWWFSAILVGLILNLFSAYTKERIDGFIGRISASSRKNKEMREAQLARMATALKGNIEERMHLEFLFHKATRNNNMLMIILVALFMIIGVAALSSNWLAVGLVGIIAAWFSRIALLSHREAEFMEKVLWRSVEDRPFWKSHEEPKETKTPASES